MIESVGMSLQDFLSHFFNFYKIFLDYFPSGGVVSYRDSEDIDLFEMARRHETFRNISNLVPQNLSQLVVWISVVIAKLKAD